MMNHARIVRRVTTEQPTACGRWPTSAAPTTNAMSALLSGPHIMERFREIAKGGVLLDQGRRFCLKCGAVGKVIAVAGAVIPCPKCGGELVPSAGPEDTV